MGDESKAGGLDLVQIIDERVDTGHNDHRQYGVFSGSSQQSTKTFISQSFDDGSINIQIQVPSIQTFMSRRLSLKARFRLTFTGTSAGPGIALLQAPGIRHAVGVDPGTQYLDAPRCTPLAQVIRSCTVQMGNMSFSTNLSSYVRILQRYQRQYTDNQEINGLSGSPTVPDASQNYDDLVGFNRNPLASWKDVPQGVQEPRGSFLGAFLVQNDSTGNPGDIAVVDIEMWEPLYLSPFSFSSDQEQLDIVGVQNVEIQLQLAGRGVGALSGVPSGLWSHAPSGSVLTGVTAQTLGASCEVTFLTPSPLEMPPPSVTYSYFENTLYPTNNLAPIIDNTSTQLVQNTVQLNSIPNRMYIFVSEVDRSFDITKTDTFFRIDGISLTFMNGDAKLANLSGHQLWLMSVKNGYNGSWDDWSRHTGSVLAIQFGEDVSMTATQAPGVRVAATMSMQINCHNIMGRDVVPTLNVLVIQEGIVVIRSGTVSKAVGILTEQDVLDARTSTRAVFQRSKNIFGSGFFDKIGSFLKKGLKIGVDIGKQFAPILPPQAKAALAIGEQISSALGNGGLSRRQIQAMLAR